MTETLIVGGGLAGSAAAATLAQAGERVRLLERHAEPLHKVCGEFLSVEARRYLEVLGLNLDRLGGARISQLRVAWGERLVQQSLPFTALGLTRRRLDEALMAHAQAHGARIERGVVARRLADGVVQTTAGDVRPETLLLASGKHDVRGAKRQTAGAITRLIGFKMYYRPPPAVRAALNGTIEVILFQGGYAGLQLVEGGIANLCLVCRDDTFAALGANWAALFARLLKEPHLRRRLSDAEPLLPRPLTVAGTPYGFVHRDGAEPPPNLYRLGDQAAVIPSFCGDGMAIALHSGRLAARAVLAHADAPAYHRRLRRDVVRQVRSATALQRFGDSTLGRSLIMNAAALAPSLLSVMAAWSRVPDRAMRGVAVVAG